MRRLIPGTWLAYVLFLIPASVALASNANSRSRRLSTFRRIFDTVPYRGGSLTKASEEIGSVSDEKIYSNADILEILNGSIGVSNEQRNGTLGFLKNSASRHSYRVLIDRQATVESVISFGRHRRWS